MASSSRSRFSLPQRRDQQVGVELAQGAVGGEGRVHASRGAAGRPCCPPAGRALPAVVSSVAVASSSSRGRLGDVHQEDQHVGVGHGLPGHVHHGLAQLVPRLVDARRVDEDDLRVGRGEHAQQLGAGGLRLGRRRWRPSRRPGRSPGCSCPRWVLPTMATKPDLCMKMTRDNGREERRPRGRGVPLCRQIALLWLLFPSADYSVYGAMRPSFISICTSSRACLMMAMAFLYSSSRLAREAGNALLLGLHGHGHGLAREDLPVVHGGGDVVVLQAAILGHLGQLHGGGDAHLVGDGLGADVQGAAEDAREAGGVVHLVREVGAAGGHDAGAGVLGIPRPDLRAAGWP